MVRREVFSSHSEAHRSFRAANRLSLRRLKPPSTVVAFVLQDGLGSVNSLNTGSMGDLARRMHFTAVNALGLYGLPELPGARSLMVGEVNFSTIPMQRSSLEPPRNDNACVPSTY